MSEGIKKLKNVRSHEKETIPRFGIVLNYNIGLSPIWSSQKAIEDLLIDNYDEAEMVHSTL